MKNSNINESPTWLKSDTHVGGQPMHVVPPSLPTPIAPLSKSMMYAWGWPVMTNSNINESPTWLESITHVHARTNPARGPRTTAWTKSPPPPTTYVDHEPRAAPLAPLAGAPPVGEPVEESASTRHRRAPPGRGSLRAWCISLQTSMPCTVRRGPAPRPRRVHPASKTLNCWSQ